MVTLIKSDLEFILEQIEIAEAHTAGGDLLTLVGNSFVPFGLRTVDGSFNNILPGQTDFGAADQDFPLLLEQEFRNDGDGDAFGPVTNTNYASTTNVVDADPRIISNLIVDQTIANPAAVEAYVAAGLGILADGSQIDPGTLAPYAVGTLLGLDLIAIPAGQTLFLGNTTPDEGLSAPFNGWFTFFGQFFDHGLDLVDKGGAGTIFIPLQPDDPLYIEGATTNFMMLTRATNTLVNAGADTILGTSDDIHRHNNETTPFVDQNQTYTSHASHQVFLREYELDLTGRPVATGRMLDGADGGLPTWADVKAKALAMLGIELTDADVHDVPLLRTDLYGKFIPDPATGFAQVITGHGADSIPNTDDDDVVVGSPGSPVDLSAVGAFRTGHAFLNDIAHHATPGASQIADADAGPEGEFGDDGDAATYDDELLDAHFITGDGRGNENIGLTAVHHIFHSEHNRQVEAIQATIVADAQAMLAGGATQDDAVAFLNEWLDTGILVVPATPAGLDWNGERLFQAARFATEMQYQHLVFEEFARKVQPNVDEFLSYDASINPAIFAEFAHVVYRFGHSMLTETIDRLDPNFVSSDIALLDAFLNPLAFNENGTLTAGEAAGAIIRGMTRQQGNEIDEFVTDVLRNSLLGLPLDLPTINLTRGRDTGVPSLNVARRDFFEHTGDSQLRPYTSWVDFAAHLKNESSIVNFIAAYGNHELITAQTTNEGRRDAALTIITGVSVGGLDVPADAMDFLNGTGIYALGGSPGAGALGGLENVDLWIGGLAERQMPFGGLLGSTFNFVFETQMESLQNGDRFYYLHRLNGTNFLTELENNSFAKMVMANTDVTRLPADIFSTPAFILEVDQARQFNDTDGDGLLDSLDPDGVIRDNPATPGADTNYLRYTGEDHVVLGGTSGNDIIIASIGDDTPVGR